MNLRPGFKLPAGIWDAMDPATAQQTRDALEQLRIVLKVYGPAGSLALALLAAEVAGELKAEVEAKAKR